MTLLSFLLNFKCCRILRNHFFIICIPKKSESETSVELSFDYNDKTDDHSSEPISEFEPDCMTIRLVDTGDKFSEFEHEILDAHNRYRAIHGCPPLKLNLEMCNYAREWAVILGYSGLLLNRKHSFYGENLYFSKRYTRHPRSIVEKWYSEIQYYNFENHQYVPKAKNFTQMIWKSTKELGVGIMKLNKRTWVVANYDPPGNLTGSFKDNVLKKTFQYGVYIQSENSIEYDSDNSDEQYYEKEEYYDEKDHEREEEYEKEYETEDEYDSRSRSYTSSFSDHSYYY